MVTIHELLEREAASRSERPRSGQVIPIEAAGTTRYAHEALQQEITNVATAPEGARNHTLNRAAFNLAQLVAAGHLPATEAREALTAAAQRAGLPTREIDATLRSAWEGASDKPRTHVPDPDLEDQWVPEPTTLSSAGSSATNGASTPPMDTQPAPDADESLAEDEAPPPGRRLVLTPASTIKPRPVTWIWDGRLALGTLGLIAGREGLGKSTLAYWMAARITKGELPGKYAGSPKGVLVAATEDSWEHTIVPRLLAAGADLDLIFRIEVLSAEDIHVGLSLPRDLHALEQGAQQADAALLVLDPLMSRLDGLDTHKDSEVRLALEPLVAVADRTNMAILGLMHHNKSGSTDPLQMVMGSKAFTAVARSVHTVIPDPDDETDSIRLFGTPKNNLGRTDLPTLSFTVGSSAIDTDEGTAWTSSLNWGAELSTSINEAMRRAGDDDRSATAEAAGWLEDYLTQAGGRAPSNDIKKDGQTFGHSQDALKRARSRVGATVESEGFPRMTFWALPGPVALTEGQSASQRNPAASVSAGQPQLEHSQRKISRGDTPTAPTAPTVPPFGQSVQSVQSEQAPRSPAPTGAPTAVKACPDCLEPLTSPPAAVVCRDRHQEGTDGT